MLEDLSNPKNVKDITKELLNYLIESESEDEIINEVTEKLCSIIEIYAPTRRWQVDKIIRVLTLAGRHVTDDSIGTLLQLIAATSELQAYSISKIFSALKENLYQDALARVNFWCIGEFGELIRDG